MNVAFVAYVVGVIIALAVMRDPWRSRIITALLWPLGPIAFLIVVPILLLAAAILWPVPVLGSAAVIYAVIYLVGC